ncbi:MAG TPA: hypothetical protein VFA90_05905 [Terriglobales bacterium]|nr:hypothetical protein [Terriglobales bacterium]
MATTMSASIAARFQMNRSIKSPTANRKHRIARFVSAFVDPKPLTTKFKHFGHEWHPVQLPIAIQCSQDFLLATNFNPITYSKSAHQAPSSFFAIAVAELLLVLLSSTTFLICWLLILLKEKSLLMLAIVALGLKMKPHNCSAAAQANRARLNSSPSLANVLL